MSAQGHPPGCDHLRYCARCSAYVGDLATMRAAAGRCAELEGNFERLSETFDELSSGYLLRADKAEAALAKVTAERDGARDEAETWRRYAHIEDRGYLREVGAAAEFPWERATPMEGD